ncbi:uncharacterized protein B0T23DRAFT_423528 [Neurospora hispaniola]|uniref:2EXR domain-containing protein n=1 Tax=Neurospora hispaniola TaxID=588809 RepID=A0AAJ0HZJ3_9PEZI|nr:hypothetical protein B0T23DRAFT_423528 [Neurospora hispaniola]
MAATSFHRFMYLPFELRARVWELTAEPRTVDVATKDMIISPIASLCREARQLGVYRQLFSELEDIRDGGERRYVWLNLELDIVDVEDAPLEDFIPVAASIKRLKFTTDLIITEDMMFLGQCVNLKELHIDNSGAYGLNFYEVFKRFPLHCGMENILVVDALLGLVPLKVEYDLASWLFRSSLGFASKMFKPFPPE